MGRDLAVAVAKIEFRTGHEPACKQKCCLNVGAAARSCRVWGHCRMCERSLQTHDWLFLAWRRDAEILAALFIGGMQLHLSALGRRQTSTHRESQRELWHIYVQIAVLGHAVHLLIHLLSVDISPFILRVQSSIYISIHPCTFLTFIYLFIHHHCPFSTDRENKSIQCGHCGIRLGLWCQDGWHNKGKSNKSVVPPWASRTASTLLLKSLWTLLEGSILPKATPSFGVLMVVIKRTTWSICMCMYIYSALFLNESPVGISFEKLGAVVPQEVVQVFH